MDKEPPYETFQFIDTSNTNTDMNQLLVLQEDGTLLSVNRDIQYITQVQDVKDVIEGDVQTCAVFGVSAQQFYVDVDTTSDLIVQDHFTDENIYTNSFLIQPEAREAAETMETETLQVSTLKSDLQTQIEPDITNGKPNNFTEITLTEAQYHLLEQKGWILLEFGGRVFILDTLGLHDITNDEKLILKLRIELEHTTSQIESEYVKSENIQSSAENLKHDMLEVDVPPLVETEDPSVLKEEAEDGNINNHFEKEPSVLNAPVQVDEPNIDSQHDGNVTTNVSQRKCDSIKIKTKYTFSDIPEKIFLGKTVNGKKLYAKVTKSKHKEQTNVIKELGRKNFEKDKTNVDSMNDAQFTNIIQDYIREHPSKVQISNVVAVDTVVTQLLQMPHIRNTVMGNYIIVTKTVVLANADGKEKTRRKPITITGEVKSFDDGHGRFVHTPYMLHNMASPDTNTAETHPDTPNNITQEFIEFVHVHITETKMPRKASVQSINVSNRKISVDVIRDAKKRHANPVYACGACAAVFKTHSALKDHLENHCIGATDPDDALTIDTDQINDQSDTYYMLDTGKEKWYSCTQCEAKFLKLFNCKKHIKSHLRPIKENPDGKEATDSNIKEYKCKMCSSKYFHASSLSKHIVKRHIQVHTNKQP